MSNKSIIIPENGGIQSILTSVPQGLVSGPALWNIYYDGVLRLNLPFKAEIVGYVDELVMVAKTGTTETLDSPCLRH